MKRIENISVVGLGTLGTQIAIQAAAYGYNVDGFDPDSGAFARTQTKVRGAMQMVRKGTTFPVAQWERHAGKVRIQDDLASAVAAADLVIEVGPEDLEIKRRVFSELDRLSPRQALLATNSSSIPISKIETATRRPENCLNIHFYQPAVGMNMADIMGGTRTFPEALSIARDCVSSIGCVPLPVQKILGFCFNSVWRAVKRQSLYMWAGGFVDFRDIDRAWMVFTGMTYGPFFLMDLVGLDVIFAIEKVYFLELNDPRDQPPAALMEKIGRGELGVKTGWVFIPDPDPNARARDFSKARMIRRPQGRLVNRGMRDGACIGSKPETGTIVLEAAKKVLRQNGYSKLSTRDVAAAAGVPLSQIHYHFGSKQGMVLALFEYLNSQLLDRQAALFEDRTLKLSEQWDRACDYLDDDIDSGYVRVLQELVAASWADAPVAKVVRAGIMGWLDLITQLARRAEREFGALGPFSAEEVAALIANAFIGAESHYLLDWRREACRCAGRCGASAISFAWLKPFHRQDKVTRCAPNCPTRKGSSNATA